MARHSRPRDKLAALVVVWGARAQITPEVVRVVQLELVPAVLVTATGRVGGVAYPGATGATPVMAQTQAAVAAVLAERTVQARLVVLV